jgi:hypothetical protein
MTDVLVRHLRYPGGHRFAVVFTDGMAGAWDYACVKQRPGPMATPLHDEAYVARAFLEAGAPAWPNGWDVSPEALHESSLADGVLKPTAKAGLSI